MNTFHCPSQRIRFVGLAIAAFLFTLLSIIPIRLAIAFHQAPMPQAILTLGGGKEREQFTAQFAQKHPTLEIWISSGIRPDTARSMFRAAGIPQTQVHIDCRAIDTITNFTTLVADFKQRHLQHLYLITADFHMARAQAIATFVLGSQGIFVTPVPIPHQSPNPSHSPESWQHTLRDSARAITWILTGHTGASLNPNPPIPCT
ncbi:MAG: YdcF family protein [Thermosynechococcaceae cyanobacterium]